MCQSLRLDWFVETCLFIDKIKTECCDRTSVGLVLPDACNHPLDSGELVTSSIYTHWELAKTLYTTAKYFSERRRAFWVWTALQKKSDSVESATANEDNLSRFKSKLQGFFFFLLLFPWKFSLQAEMFNVSLFFDAIQHSPSKLWQEKEKTLVFLKRPQESF